MTHCTRCGREHTTAPVERTRGVRIASASAGAVVSRRNFALWTSQQRATTNASSFAENVAEAVARCDRQAVARTVAHVVAASRRRLSLEKVRREGEAHLTAGRVDEIEAELAQVKGGGVAERIAERGVEWRAEGKGPEGQAAGSKQRASHSPSPLLRSPTRLSPSWMPVPARRLGWAAESSALPVIALDLFNTHRRPPLHMRCHGRACPAFSPCGDAFGNVEACWNRDLVTDKERASGAPLNCPRIKGAGRRGYGRDGDREEGEEGLMANLTCSHAEDFIVRDAVAFQVFRLHHVFVSHLGYTFNRTHRFLRNGCSAYTEFSFPSSTRVHKVARAINWAHGSGLAFFHMLVEAVPQFYNLAHVLPSFYGERIPIISSKKQARVWERVVAPLVGISREAVRLIVPADDHLIFAHTLVEPSRQYCGVPARGLWYSLRRRHLLHPRGIPIFHPNLIRKKLTPLTDAEMAQLPGDWVVVLVRRPGTERVMDQEGEVEESMRGMFGERLVVYGQSLPILQARDLFRRTRLVVAVHGAGLSHTIFMPNNASVLEVRPRDYHNTCLHHLAEACDLKYYLTLGEGKKKGILKVDVQEIMRVVAFITRDWEDIPG
ncbi:hypothetical protein CLOM_g4090 [Closterium sp. NIES-68]|nr:hypothetical protein CLOM_g4090 [Closterium sp. NIES-68]